MIMIAPPEAEPVLAVLLNPRGGVAAFPVGALGFEEQLAGHIAPDQAKDPVEGLMGGTDAFRIARKLPTTRPPQFPSLYNVRQFIALEGRGHEPDIGPALDCLALSAVFFSHHDSAIA